MWSTLICGCKGVYIIHVEVISVLRMGSLLGSSTKVVSFIVPGMNSLIEHDWHPIRQLWVTPKICATTAPFGHLAILVILEFHGHYSCLLHSLVYLHSLFQCCESSSSCKSLPRQFQLQFSKFFVWSVS